MSDCARPLLPSRHGAVGDGPRQVQTAAGHVNITENKDNINVSNSHLLFGILRF